MGKKMAKFSELNSIGVNEFINNRLCNFIYGCLLPHIIRQLARNPS